MNLKNLSVRVLFLPIGLCLLAGCNKEEQVTSYTAPKEAASRQEAQPVSWTVPAGWKPAPYDQNMQFAAFTTGAGEGAVKVTVSSLSASAPGARDLLQNVNRWRGQLGLAPAAAADLSKLVTLAGRGATTMQKVDLAGEGGRRMVATIVPREDRIWFFKMTGPTADVEAQKEAFDKFVQGSQFTAAGGPPLMAGGGGAGTMVMPPIAQGTAPLAPPPTSPGPDGPVDELTFAVPAGWTSQPNANPMRLATLSTGGDKPAQLIVTRLSTNFGGMQANLTRWHTEVGLPPADAEQAEKPIKIGSADGSLVDLVGPGKDGATPTRSLIARRTLGDSVWFFKIIGPAQSVTEQQKTFETFLTSVKLPGEQAK